MARIGSREAEKEAASVIIGFPLSVSGKNPYFDRSAAAREKAHRNGAQRIP